MSTSGRDCSSPLFCSLTLLYPPRCLHHLCSPLSLAVTADLFSVSSELHTHTHTHADAGRPQLSRLISWSITELPGICPDHTNSGNRVTGGYADQPKHTETSGSKGKMNWTWQRASVRQTQWSRLEKLENDLNVDRSCKYTERRRTTCLEGATQFYSSQLFAATLNEGAGGRSVS